MITAFLSGRTLEPRPYKIWIKANQDSSFEKQQKELLRNTWLLEGRHLVLPNSCKASQQTPAKVLAPHEKMEELGWVEAKQNCRP